MSADRLAASSSKEAYDCEGEMGRIVVVDSICAETRDPRMDAGRVKRFTGGLIASIDSSERVDWSFATYVCNHLSVIGRLEAPSVHWTTGATTHVQFFWPSNSVARRTNSRSSALALRACDNISASSAEPHSLDI